MKIHDCIEAQKLIKQQGAKIEDAIAFAVKWGDSDGAHHKAWVIDMMVRLLAGKNYEKVIAKACNGEDGPNTFEWDHGIAP